MFGKDTYTERRQTLKQLVGNGIIVLFGNNESPSIILQIAISLSGKTPLSCTILVCKR